MGFTYKFEVDNDDAEVSFKPATYRLQGQLGLKEICVEMDNDLLIKMIPYSNAEDVYSVIPDIDKSFFLLGSSHDIGKCSEFFVSTESSGYCFDLNEYEYEKDDFKSFIDCFIEAIGKNININQATLEQFKSAILKLKNKVTHDNDKDLKGKGKELESSELHADVVRGVNGLTLFANDSSSSASDSSLESSSDEGSELSSSGSFSSGVHWVSGL